MRLGKLKRLNTALIFSGHDSEYAGIFSGTYQSVLQHRFLAGGTVTTDFVAKGSRNIST
jgi:hypothetical protein